VRKEKRDIFEVKRKKKGEKHFHVKTLEENLLLERKPRRGKERARKESIAVACRLVLLN
jgi:hypothetical protein